MQKIYGAPGPQNGLYKIGKNKWELFYGFGKDNDQEETGWNYRERFDHRPSLDEIKETIVGVIESEYADKLRYGLTWNELPVEYTEERKSDLTGMLVAMQAGIMELPVTLNLGTYPDGSPVFHEFAKPEEIIGVAKAISNHKIAVCNAEWQEKSSVDWSVYETEQ